MSPDFFTNNRHNLRALLGGGLFVATAHNLVQKSDDTSYPFRQDSNFWYLTGLDVPDSILVIDGNDEYVFIPDPTEFNATWHGNDLTVDQAQAMSGIKTVYYLSQKATILKQIFTRHTTVHMVVAETMSELGFQPNPAHRTLKSMLRRYGAKEFNDCTAHLQRLRMVKAPAEISILKEVTLETEVALEKLRPLARAGVYEYELAAYLTAEFIRKNYRQGYEPIVATGDNAFILHYEANNSVLSDGEMVLVDAGAQKMYYSADVTRMIRVGVVSAEFEAAHAVVESWQQLIVNELKPGALLKDVGRLFREKMLEYLQAHNILPATAELRDTLPYCPHGFGHYLGLDIHDAADYDAPLQAGMVFMVEPGLYIKEAGIAIRIEDAYLITKDSCIKLTEVIE